MSGFLSIEQVATLLATSERTIQRHISAGKYTTRQVPAKGGKDGLKYEIALTSLPKEAQNRYHEQIFNQQVEVIYGQEKSTACHADSSISRGHNSGTDRGIHTVASGANGTAINAANRNIGSGVRHGVVASGKVFTTGKTEQRTVTAAQYIAGNAATRKAGTMGLRDAERNESALAVDSRGQDVGSVSDVRTARAHSALDGTTKKQREIDLAIKVIFSFIKGFGGSELAAIRHINMHYITGDLPKAMMHALDNCKEKKHANSSTLLSRETLHSWKKRFAATGNYAPKKRQADMVVKDWYYVAIELYRRPQQPTVTYVAEKIAELYAANGITETPPSRGQIERFFKEKMSQVDMQVGKSTGMALRSKRYHAVRSAAGMEPWQEVHADGWATHFTAPHPITGEYVTLEVWDFHDVATRFVPPFAVGLSENFEVIAKGIENAIREGGVMSILQTDSTKIVKNNAKFVGNPLLSISDRAGITIVHPKTVGNAQANGISENFHTWLDKQARELSTYQQKGMDSLSLRRTQKLTAKFVKAKASNDMALMDGVRKQISKTSNGVFFESYQQAIDWLEAVRVKWNNHHHSSLPKIYDEVTGKKRHQSPAECLAAFKADGWQPVVMDEAHIVDLFRPRVQVKVQRGVVKPYGGMRFHHVDLPHWEGKQVVVSYDIMDYSAVTVMAMDGSLICIAPFCETVAYRAMTAYETANEKRALAQIKSKRNQIKTIEQRTGLSLNVIESHGSKVIELQRFDYERVEAAPELQRVEYTVEETTAPKLRTLADLLAEEGDNEEPLSREETVDYLWGDVIDEDDEIKPIEDVL